MSWFASTPIAGDDDHRRWRKQRLVLAAAASIAIAAAACSKSVTVNAGSTGSPDATTPVTEDAGPTPDATASGPTDTGVQLDSGAQTYGLSVTVTGNGSLQSDPAGIACSGGTMGNCEADFPSGTEVTA